MSPDGCEKDRQFFLSRGKPHKTDPRTHIMAIQTDKYAAVYDNFKQAIAWMKSLGVVPDATRLTHYEKVVGHWHSHYKNASDEEAKEVFPNFTSSMYEVHDFIDIYLAFREEPVNRLVNIGEKLQKAVTGPIHSIDETQKNVAARNYLFEVATAARSHRPEQGVHVIFDAPSDTGVVVDDTEIWIECKRVTSANKIEANVRDASKQLERVLASNPDSAHRGIVALDVSKVLTQGDEIFVRQDEHTFLRDVDLIMDRFVLEHTNDWRKVYRRRDAKVIGTLVRFSFMSSVEDRNQLVHTQQWALNPRSDPGSPDSQLLLKLCQQMQPR